MNKTNKALLIKIEEDFCKGCGYCIEICPKKIFSESAKRNKRGYTLPAIQNIEECLCCKKCELICPEMAISVILREEREAVEE